MDKVLKIFKVILVGTISLYIVVALFLYFFQTNLLFFPQNMGHYYSDKSIENVEIEVEKGIYVRGWIYNNDSKSRNKLLLCFEGNASDVGYLLNRTKAVHDYSVALINYRGYGMSDGSPSEKSLFSDACKIYDYFANRNDIDSSHIVVLGRSLGTGVATCLASKRDTKAVILVSPYDSILNIAKEQFGIFPVDLILNNKFNSVEYAKNIDTRLLGFYVEGDTVVGNAHTFKLFEAWKGKKELKKIESATNHNDTMLQDELWNYINEFLKGL